MCSGIRDLQFPADAREVIDNLHIGLGYDSAIALLSAPVSKITVKPTDWFESAFYPNASAHEVQGVISKAPELLSRLAFVTMVSRFEESMSSLLLQRVVIDTLLASNQRMNPETMWSVLEKTHKLSKEGVRKTALYVAGEADEELTLRLSWLDGLIDVRNCLIHRFGRVQMIDCKPKGSPLRDSQESDRLRATWMKAEVRDADGNAVDETRRLGENPEFRMVAVSREWKVGDTLHITPQESQDLARTLSLIANAVLAAFERSVATKARS